MLFEGTVNCYRVEEDYLAKFMYEVGRSGLTYGIRKEEKDPDRIYVGGYKPVYRVHVYTPWWAGYRLERLFRKTFGIMSVEFEW